MQSRAKWHKIWRNFKTGDIVFLKSNTILNQWQMTKVIDAFIKVMKVMCEQSNYMLEITNVMRMTRNIWFVRFTRYKYCYSTTEKQTTYIIKMMNHLEGSHVLLVESCEF